MSDRREQASTFVIATVVAGVVLSLTVGAVVAVSGTTAEFDLDPVSNNGLPTLTETTTTDTPTESPTRPAISVREELQASSDPPATLAVTLPRRFLSGPVSPVS